MDILVVCKSSDHSKVSQTECVLLAFGTNNNHVRFAPLLSHLKDLKQRSLKIKKKPESEQDLPSNNEPEKQKEKDK